jgi:Calx-beta domain
MPVSYVNVDDLVNAEIAEIVVPLEATVAEQAATITAQDATIDAQAAEIERLEDELANAGGEVAPLPTVSVSDAPTISEESGGKARFEISALEAYNKAINVPFATEDGTAKKGEDYTETVGTAIIPIGQLKVNVDVPVLNDTLVEQKETFSLKIYAPYININLGKDKGAGEITSDDTQPPIPPEPSGERPTQANTGCRVPNPPLYTGSNLISVANTIIEGRTIDKPLSITGRNVTLRDCIVTATGVWQIEADTGRDLKAEYCDFRPSGGASTPVKSILGQGIFHHNDFSNMCIAMTTKGGVTHFHHNLIRDLRSTAGSHFDGVFIAGDEIDSIFEYNDVTVPQNGGTAAFFFATRWQGANITRPICRYNWMPGKPSYNVYFEDTDVANIIGAQFYDNWIARGQYGYYTISGCTVDKHGNKDYTTGAPI